MAMLAFTPLGNEICPDVKLCVFNVSLLLYLQKCNPSCDITYTFRGIGIYRVERACCRQVYRPGLAKSPKKKIKLFKYIVL